MALSFPTSPIDGEVYISDPKIWIFNTLNTTWESSDTSAYDFVGGIPGAPTSSQLVAEISIVRDVSFPLNFAGSVWNAGTAAASITTFDVQINGISIGSIIFAAGSATATFTTVSTGTTFVLSPSVLTIVAPATVDITLADAYGTLLGVLT